LLLLMEYTFSLPQSINGRSDSNNPNLSYSKKSAAAVGTSSKANP
jgi:hypothetical protein